MQRLTVLALAVGLFAGLGRTQSDAEVAALEAAGARAVVAVEKELSFELGEPIAFRFATRTELRRILTRELKPQMLAQLGDEKAAEQQAEQMARTLAQAMYAKFDHGAREILVCTRNIELIADALDRPALTSAECLQAILVHEVAHAAADEMFGWPDALDKLSDTDAYLAFNAVVEGHAQFVARRACATKGWTEPFETFTASIGATPASDDEGLRQLMRIAAVQSSWAYHDGERFIAAIHAHGGDEAVAKAFAAPPASPALILRPEWYLDPASRPEVEYSFDDALETFAARFDEEAWIANTAELPAPQLRAAMALLPEAEVDRILEHCLGSRIVVLNSRQNPGERVIAAAAFEADSYAEAAHFLAAEERLLREKDIAMKSGTIRIVKSEYAQIEDGSIRGLFAQKRVAFGGKDFPVTSVVLAKGRIAVELSFSNHEIEKDAAIRMATEFIGSIETAPGSPATPEAKKDR